VLVVFELFRSLNRGRDIFVYGGRGKKKTASITCPLAAFTIAKIISFIFCLDPKPQDYLNINSKITLAHSAEIPVQTGVPTII
jgi:hypothetical protein